MKAEVLKSSHNGNTQIVVTVADNEFMALGERVMIQAIDLAAKTLADELVRERGAKMVAEIPVQAVLNRVIAAAALKIGNAAAEA